MRSTKNNNFVQHRSNCVICGGLAKPLLDFPNLPLTDSYTRFPISNPIMGIDQRFLYCELCGHGQLESLVAASILYGSNYCFRTSTSTTARKGTTFFLSLLNEIEPSRKFNCALDLGCNDLLLLGLLKDRVNHRIGIDPVWNGLEDEREDQSIQLFGANFEDVDLSQLPDKPDLIICRHTFEHIINPIEVLQTLLKIAADDALFIFEVPGLDGLIKRYRFDQVFHQHVQYFSLASFLKMLEVVDGRYLTHRFNFHDWGAMAIAFIKRSSSDVGYVARWLAGDIEQRYSLFQDQMEISGNILRESADLNTYGYGAAQMLPVIGYHMRTNFGELQAVIDDDDAKDGIGYWNLPVKVISAKKKRKLDDCTILITAIDNIQPIMIKLMKSRPRHILLPINII